MSQMFDVLSAIQQTEMFWNQTERKVWVKWKIATSENEIKKWKVTTITTSEELDDLARIASSE